MKWRDISSFSRDSTDRTPRSWETTAGGLRIVVTRHVAFAPNEWVMTCAPWISTVAISEGTAEEAKKLAEDIVREKLLAALKAIGS